MPTTVFSSSLRAPKLPSFVGFHLVSDLQHSSESLHGLEPVTFVWNAAAIGTCL